MSGRPHPLQAVLEPRSIAVIGASADPSKRGFQILRALAESGFSGPVHPVNPRGGTILGHPVLQAVEDLPAGIDLAVLCTPAASAPGIVRTLGSRGVRAAVILAVGFGESGGEGARLERELLEASRETGVRLVGPNTSGVLNLHRGLNLIGAPGVRAGGLALVVQSGNMALSLMKEATERSWEGISVCLGVGNELDLGFTEAMEYLAEHEETRGILIYAEGFEDGRHFLAAAARCSRAKPVVLIKSGRSQRGAQAALSHTGAVAGPYDRLAAGLAQAGITELHRTDELLHVAETLANQPPLPPGRGIAVLSDGGGQGTLAADRLEELGAPMAELEARTRDRLRELLGPAAALSNPVDLAGAADADPRVFARALEILADDPQVGCVLVVGLFGGYGIRFAEGLTELEVEAARRMADRVRSGTDPEPPHPGAAGPPALVVHTMYAHHRSRPLEVLGEARIPVIGSLEVACRAVSELDRRGRRLEAPAWPAESGGTPTPRDGEGAAPRPLGPGPLPEPEARRLLAEHGVRMARFEVVAHESELEEALTHFRGPVVLKVVSSAIVHKSDAGGVRLGLEGIEAVREGFRAIARDTAAYARAQGLPPEPLRVLVTHLAPRPQAELLVGAYRDASLGPVLTLGDGGLWVEVWRDVAHRVLPVDRALIREALSELRMRPLLEGVRGAPPADLEAIVDTAMGLAACMEAHPEIAEIEINPLFVYPQGVEPVDARVICSAESDPPIPGS